MNFELNSIDRPRAVKRSKFVSPKTSSPATPYYFLRAARQCSTSHYVLFNHFKLPFRTISKPNRSLQTKMKFLNFFIIFELQPPSLLRRFATSKKIAFAQKQNEPMHNGKLYKGKILILQEIHRSWPEFKLPSESRKRFKFSSPETSPPATPYHSKPAINHQSDFRQKDSWSIQSARFLHILTLLAAASVHVNKNCA